MVSLPDSNQANVIIAFNYSLRYLHSCAKSSSKLKISDVSTVSHQWWCKLVAKSYIMHLRSAIWVNKTCLHLWDDGANRKSNHT